MAGILSLSNCKRTYSYLKRNGLKAAYFAALERLEEKKKLPYAYESPAGEVLETQKQEVKSWEERMLFSVVVPAYETKQEYLKALILSLQEQSYPYWELILCDASQSDQVRVVAHETQDYRIRYIRLKGNMGISGNTNPGIEAAEGDFIGLLDHDDILTPDALYEMAKAIKEARKEGKNPRLLYSDEDKCDGEGLSFYEPNLKPDFNLDYLLSNNYICHFLVMERELMKSLKLWPQFDGAQDYDLLLRAVEELDAFKTDKAEKYIVHVAKVLYHWRCHSDSTAANPSSKVYAYEAGKRALAELCERQNWKAEVSHSRHLGFYELTFEDLFRDREDIGCVAAPEAKGKLLVSAIYEEDGSLRYEGLPREFSGYMHRAVLPQNVETADIRHMKVRKELQEEYKEAIGRGLARTALAKAGMETEPEQKVWLEESREFCRLVKEKGYRILWLPLTRKEGNN